LATKKKKTKRKKPRRKGEATRRGRRRKRGKKGGGFEFVNYGKWLKTRSVVALHRMRPRIQD
jgi:hypothetical protein